MAGVIVICHVWFLIAGCSWFACSCMVFFFLWVHKMVGLGHAGGLIENAWLKVELWISCFMYFKDDNFVWGFVSVTAACRLA